MQKLPGIILMLSGLIAMLLGNSPFGATYFNLINAKQPFNVLFVVNDVLMTIFFLDVGFEIKQQIVSGHLSKPKQILLPLLAACGGVIVPAFIFAMLNYHNLAALKGWAIPTATDIAFALGVFMLLSDKIPDTLRVLLLTIAVVDDLLAIIIISLFYSHSISIIWLMLTALCIIGLWLLNKRQQKNIIHYFMVGGLLWLCMLSSGIHPTLSGVITALFIPLTLHHGIHKKLSFWVAFIILPIFALTNAGVSLRDIKLTDLFQTVPLGITLGLLLGKQIGIFSTAWLSTKMKLASKPKEITWKQLYGMAIICGIGFTMSIFIANLAYADSLNMLVLSKLGILTGSLISALLGYIFLRVTS